MKYNLTDDDDPYNEISSQFLKYLCSEENIECIFLNCNKNPTDHQVDVCNKLIENNNYIFDIIANNSINYWNSILDDPRNQIGRLHKLTNIVDLGDYLEIRRIYIHNDIEINEYTTIGFSGSWPIDDEHGFGLTMKYDTLTSQFNFIEVGHQSIAFSDAMDDFNFKDKKEMNQAIASLSTDIANMRSMINAGTWRKAYSADEQIRKHEKYIEQIKILRDKKYPQNAPNK